STTDGRSWATTCPGHDVADPGWNQSSPLIVTGTRASRAGVPPSGGTAPQHRTVPSSVSRQPPPIVIDACTALVTPSVGTGTAENGPGSTPGSRGFGVCVPMPSWPNRLVPQHRPVPSPRTAQAPL